MADWITGTVNEIEYSTDTLFRLKLTAPVAPFKAGQFAKLSLNVGGERVQRAYSYVNAPSDKQLEFYLVKVPDGKLSPSLGQLRAGDEIHITRDATGFLVLEEVPDCNILWMLATGTGVGPYLSILQEGEGLARFQHIVLVHAVRLAQDLSYLSLMHELQQRYQGQLIVQTIVSQESVPGALTGRIPKLIAEGALEAAVGQTISAQSSHIMLCGNPQMVRDTQQVLKDQYGMSKHLRRKPGHITSENYW